MVEGGPLGRVAVWLKYWTWFASSNELSRVASLVVCLSFGVVLSELTVWIFWVRPYCSSMCWNAFAIATPVCDWEMLVFCLKDISGSLIISRRKDRIDPLYSRWTIHAMNAWWFGDVMALVIKCRCPGCSQSNLAIHSQHFSKDALMSHKNVLLEVDVWLASSQQNLQFAIVDDVDQSAVFSDPLHKMGTVTMNI